MPKTAASDEAGGGARCIEGQVRATADSMLDVGLVGLGAAWDGRYRPALQRLRPRLRVRSVYACVANRAELAALDLQCAAAHGIVTLLERPDLKGILVLDPGWHGPWPVDMALRYGKAVFLAATPDWDQAVLRRLARTADEAGQTLMPELNWRFWPATVRLRELLATVVGRPHTIRLELPAHTPLPDTNPDPIWPVALEAIDWCRMLLATPCERTRQTAEQCWQLDFRPSAGGGGPTAVHIAARQQGPIRAALDCARGRVRLESPVELHWETPHDTQHESLAAERSDLDLMLDHFSRRVVGGLIPVPTLSDVDEAAQLCHCLR